MKKVAIIGLCLLALAGMKPRGDRAPVPGGKKKTPLVAVSMAASNWYQVWGSTFDEPFVKPNAGGGWYFDFPQAPENLNDCLDPFAWCPQVDYVLTHETAPITNQFLTVTVGVTPTGGSPWFNYRTESGNTCTFPASVRMVLVRLNDDWATDGNRWWSNPIHIELDSVMGGVSSVTVPLAPSQWSGIFGLKADANTTTLSDFANVLMQPGLVGFSFGGGCFFGHGLNVVDGAAQFICLDYRFHD